ncbi:MAG: hypothetical protein NC938_05270 [Candidatus Omnitrophica bacterium]|nr:hypothetical protein [Candidatus Omnitrophota bacterium]
MNKASGLFMIASALLCCSAAIAGPIDNAAQFQQKAARSAAKEQYEKTLKPKGTAITSAEGGFVSPPAQAIVNTGSTTSQAVKTIINKTTK